MFLSVCVWLCVSRVYLWPFRVELPLTRRCVVAPCAASRVLNLTRSLQQMLNEKGEEADSEGWMPSVSHRATLKTRNTKQASVKYERIAV